MVANAGIIAIKSVFESKAFVHFLLFQVTERLSLLATLELFETIQAVNTRGVFLCLKHTAIQMVKQGRGGRLMGSPFTFKRFSVVSHSIAFL